MSALIRILLLMLCCLTAMNAHAAVQRTLHFKGDTRTYLVYRPAGLSRHQAVPLVIVLHGVFGSGLQAERAYHWDAKADEEHFVVVYPNALDHSWNAGGICCGSALRKHVDDGGFITAMIQTLLKTEHIDPHRVYLTGMSNGAAMTYRFACDNAYPLAAIGSVSGDLSGTCANPSPVSVMEIHGLSDQHIPFEGGQGSKSVVHAPWPPVRQGINLFRELDQCGATSIRQESGVTTEISDCKNGRQVALITIPDAGHQWPGAQVLKDPALATPNQDPPSTALDATSVLWGFFSGKHGQ